MKMNVYLNFPGNCEEALGYYEQHLGAKVLSKMRWKDMPLGPQAGAPDHTPSGMEDKLIHSRFELADTIVMGSDVPGAEPMRSAYVCLAADSSEEAERVFKALVDGGQEFMKMGETFFAHRFGQCRDRFGVNWMVMHGKPMDGGAA